jgi:hypothetical protein
MLFLDAVRSPAEERFGAKCVELREPFVIRGHETLRVFAQGHCLG